ncbi:LOW QUALITY PROTEIN: olfactory receptor 4D10-like [Spinachia spinachia]
MTHFVARIVRIKKLENSTEVVSFVLSACGNIGNLKYMYFIIILLWYITVCATNSILIVVIYTDRRLHEPMYLLCNLFINEIYISTSLYPLLLSQMFSDTHEVTLPWCFLQMFCFYIFGCVQLFNLTAMAYDRCLFVSKGSKQKVIATCTPQIVSLGNIFVGVAFHFLGSRLDIRYIPDKVRIILSIYIHILQPMITPFMYGLYLPKISQSCKRLLCQRFM